MKNKFLMAFIVISTLFLCSCEQDDKTCLSPVDNNPDGYKFDECALRTHNTPSPKREW